MVRHKLLYSYYYLYFSMHHWGWADGWIYLSVFWSLNGHLHFPGSVREAFSFVFLCFPGCMHGAGVGRDGMGWDGMGMDEWNGRCRDRWKEKERERDAHCMRRRRKKGGGGRGRDKRYLPR